MKKESQIIKILKYLQTGKRTNKTTNITKYYATITPIEALSMFGCFRLSDIIYKLKKQGFMFETCKVRNRNNNYYAQYKLL